ncbi:hypothetical protein M0R72_19365 [Candidatus Pacearchaeota archaeon]|jgi:hypothetical protein|nr:hypothetical protein [Candidatus Pacearchaeota archaeon]
MKKFILFVVILFLIGMAGAVQNFGPPSGIKVAAIDVTNDARIRGDLTLDGTLGVGTNVSNGVFAEDIALAAGYDWYSIAGGGVVDFGNMTGYFYGPTGVTLWNGNTKVTGTKTFMVNGGAAIFGSSVTAASVTSNATVAGADLMASDDAIITDDLTVDGGARIDETATINAGVINTTLSVGSADGLTVNSVIVPQEMVLTIPIGASEVDQTAFIADDAWQITKIEEAHSVAQNTAYPNTGNLSINKCTGTQAANAGAHLHNTTMWLNSTINTVATPTLNATTGALNLADGNRICLDFNGTMTTFAGGSVTIHMKRI